MFKWNRVLYVPLLASLLSCSGGAPVSAPVVGSKYLIVAGDIAQCILPPSFAALPARLTADLVKSLLARYGDQAQVMTLGDNVYPDGTAAEYRDCYEPTWGQFKSRTWAIPGNHDYGQPGAGPYYDYFGEAAGPGRVGYHKRTLGGWTVYSLNSSAPADTNSAQMAWLNSQIGLESGCRLAAWHFPVFSSATRGNDATMASVWSRLDAAGFDLVLQGHEHQYERFVPKKVDGSLATGIRSFVVGTGGAAPSGFAAIPQPGSEVRITTYGVLVLKLDANSYTWEFVGLDSRVLDAGSGTCRLQ